MKTRSGAIIIMAMFVLITQFARAQAPGADIPSSALINPAEVATLVQFKAEKPLILQVGSHVLFQQAHIPGSEYVGAASTPEGRQQLRKRVSSLSKNKSIILYCGCCPWDHCPNVKPAYQELHEMGFNNLKVMHIADNFGKDWMEKGFPTSKGE